jgi:hypothetical protein
MSSEVPPEPEPKVDEEPPRAPGGADADVSESDVGAASEGEPVTPDAPLSAQQPEAEVPDEVLEPEGPDSDLATGPDDDSPSEPTG